MIAAGKGHDAAQPLFIREIGQPMPGAPYLEGADRLQAFRLAPDSPALDRQRKQGRWGQDGSDFLRRSLHAGESGLPLRVHQVLLCHGHSLYAGFSFLQHLE